MFWLADVFNGSYSQQEVRRIEDWARRERADAVYGLFSTLARGAAASASLTGRGAKSLYAALLVFGGKLAQWNRRRAAIRELSRLSDHTLRDIGLSRDEIRSVVDGMLSGPRETQVSRSAELATVRPEGANAENGSSTSDREIEWQRAA